MSVAPSLPQESRSEVRYWRGLAEERAARIKVLEALLASEGVETVPEQASWAVGLTRQQCALMTALYAAYPRTASKWSLLDAMPPNDHAADRSIRQVAVIVSMARRALGKPAIECVHGQGYRLGPEMHAQMRGRPGGGAAGTEPASTQYP